MSTTPAQPRDPDHAHDQIPGRESRDETVDRSMEEADRANGEGDPDDTPPVDAGGKRIDPDPI